MATGGPQHVKEKGEDFRHSCTLCMEPYRGRNPKLLPCYHSFCLPCLITLETSVRSAKRDAAADYNQPKKQLHPTKSDDEETETEPRRLSLTDSADVTASHDHDDDVADDVDKGSFLCPTCRAPVPIPEGGVEALQTNFYVDHELGPDEGSPITILCDSCEENDRQNATHTCQECRQSMCPSCRRKHDKFTRDHHVTSVGLGQPAREQHGQREGKERGLCLVHQDQALCFHCRRCDVSICVHCRLTSHEGHETVDLTKAAQQAREEITSLIPTAQEQLQVMEISIQQADHEDRELTRHAQEVTQQIHSRCDDLVTWAKGSRDRLVDEASVKEAWSRGRLRSEKASNLLTRDTLSSLVSRAARATTCDPDALMTCRKELKEALLSEDKLQLLQQQTGSQGRRFRDWKHEVSDATYLLQEKDVGAYLGRVVLEEVEEGGGKDAEVSTTPYMSLRELTGRVERLTQEVTENTNIMASQVRSCTDDVTKLQQKSDQLEKKGDALEKKGDELEKKGDNLERKGAELQKRGEELQKIGERLEKKTASLEDELTTRSSAADLDKLTQSLMEEFGQARPLFSARGLNKASTQQTEAMMFNTVETNEGGHFSNQTGVFTVPQAGIYSFTATVASCNPGSPVFGQIVANGVLHRTIQAGYQEGSGCVLLHLKGGEKVWVRAISPVLRYRDWYVRFGGTLNLPISS